MTDAGLEISVYALLAEPLLAPVREAFLPAFRSALGPELLGLLPPEVRALAEGDFDAPDALRREYDSLFLVPTGAKLAPTESAYEVRTVGSAGELSFGQPRTITVSRVAEDEARLGFVVPERFAHHPPDHVGIELALLAALDDRAAACRSRGDDAGAANAEASLARFVRAHAARWMPVFARDLAERSTTRLYRLVGHLLARVVERDAAGELG